MTPPYINEDVKYCIYTGDGSHRQDWKNIHTVGGKVFVAGDSYPETKFKSDAEACAKAGVNNMAELEVALKAAKAATSATTVGK